MRNYRSSHAVPMRVGNNADEAEVDLIQTLVSGGCDKRAGQVNC